MSDERIVAAQGYAAFMGSWSLLLLEAKTAGTPASFEAFIKAGFIAHQAAGRAVCVCVLCVRASSVLPYGPAWGTWRSPVCTRCEPCVTHAR